MRRPAEVQPFADVEVQLEIDPVKIATMLREDRLYGAAFVSLSEL